MLLFLALLTSAQEPNARVIHMWEQLNVRSIPETNGPVVAELAGRTPLVVIGRTRDNAWYQVETLEGISGWVASGYIELQSIEQSEIPIVFAPETATGETAIAPSSAAAERAGNATGRVTAGMLNVRNAPSMIGAVITRLPNNTRVTVVGRSANNLWYRIQLADGQFGWVAAAYITLENAPGAVPVVDAIAENAAASAPLAAQTGDAPPYPYLALGPNTWTIFANGQGLGNHPDVFSKVGDSITVASIMYAPIGYGSYTLGSYGYLQPTIEYFSRTPTRTGSNSFNGVSLTANNGWTTRAVLDPAYANTQICAFNESPLQCEYRLNRPALALIMLGTNDVAFVPADEYAHNMRVITEFSVTQGVIPVLSTIPTRRGYEAQVDFYNQLIRDVAEQFGVPVWDYNALMWTLPGAGLSEDGVHPSIPPGGIQNAANFTGDYLQYGYVARNLSALQVLDNLRREVLQR